MSSSAELKHTNFLENILPKLIINKNEDLQGSEVLKCVANSSKSLDGFMSSMYQVQLDLKNDEKSV